LQKQAEQNEKDEDCAFWMISALVQSPGFSPYYTAPAPYDSHHFDPAHCVPDFEDPRPMSDRPAAMEDVYMLGLILARYEGETWIHLQAIGFQLPMIFFGAFMRLFAFLLPPASLFRFWDVLFADATAPAAPTPPKSTLTEERVLPRRRSLINLAFGALQRAKGDLLKCQSALEARDCIVSQLQNMWDPSDVIQVVADVERVLWQESAVRKTVDLPPPHVQDYERWHDIWDLQLLQSRQQNALICEAVLNKEIDLADTYGSQVRSNPLVDARVTTRNVVNRVIPVLQQALMPEGGMSHHHSFAGMFRPTRPKLRAIGPEMDHSVMGRISEWTTWAYEKAMKAGHIVKEFQPTPVNIPRPPGAYGEPTFMDIKTFQLHVSRALGPDWGGQFATRLFTAFQNPLEKRASLNEIFAALLGGSRGTVGEKAVALFHLFATHLPSHTIQHITPVSKSAQTVIERIDGGTVKESVTLYTPPEDSEIPAMALHFSIWTDTRSYGPQLLGEVFVPTLKPFMQAGFGHEQLHTFTIYGPAEKLPPGSVGLKNKDRANKGDFVAALTWTPAADNTPEVGQLGITLDHIKFNAYVEDPASKNPYVTVVTYDADGKQVKIPRWDPRTAMQMVRSFPRNFLLADVWGEEIEFARTMWKDQIRGKLHSQMMGVNHGWNEQDKTWCWDRRAGQQFSVEDFAVRPELVMTVQQSRPNAISLKACRILTAGILQQGLYCITNRQAALLSDSIFNRAGAAPAILEAILVEMDWDSSELGSVTNITEFKKDLIAKGVPVTDVRHQMVIAHEEFVSKSGGNLNLFSCIPDHPVTPAVTMGLNCADPNYVRSHQGEPSINLSALRIRDPYPSKRKVLLIRFARSGDGQRFNAQYNVDGLGNLTSAVELALDMPMDNGAARIQMSLTREEFVTCVMESPLLSEALRKTTMFDMRGRDPSREQHLGPIKLDVVVADPMHESADEDFLDAMNVNQLVAFEIYDYDRASLADFLGECFLPSFDKIGHEPQQFVLPIQGKSSRSRPDERHKEGIDEECTGILFIEASWTFPAEPIEEEATRTDHEMMSLEARAKKEAALHTGKLKVKILKAEGLRAADVTKSKATNDAYVAVYIRNEAFLDTETERLPVGFAAGGWRATATGVHQEEFRTKVVRGTAPTWNESFETDLMTASFERRTKQRTRHLDVTRQSAFKHRNELLLAAMGGEPECYFYFSDAPQEAQDTMRPFQAEDLEPGDRHGVKIFLGDTIFQFKIKLQEASRLEAEKESRNLQSKRYLGDGHNDVVQSRTRLQQYQALADRMCHEHVVMVFVPSKHLREMFRARRTDTVAYENLYSVEFADPSSWQPLDPSRTFMHYAPIYGFGALGADAQQLRVVEGSEDYKLRNSRYRHFMQEQSSWHRKVHETNTVKMCFGYAKYLHAHDGESEEWRPALVERFADLADDPAADLEGSRKFLVSYLNVASTDVGPDATAGENADANKVVMDESRLLLAPAMPKIFGAGNLEHSKLLKQAPMLEDQGMSEADIVRHLNAQLQEAHAARQELQESAGLAVGRTSVPPITPQMVRTALRVQGGATG